MITGMYTVHVASIAADGNVEFIERNFVSLKNTSVKHEGVAFEIIIIVGCFSTGKIDGQVFSPAPGYYLHVQLYIRLLQMCLCLCTIPIYLEIKMY